MRVLGLSVFCDSSAAIINDNKIVCAVEEERVNRIKHYEGFPWCATDECLNIADMALRDVDIIAIGWNPYKGWINRIKGSMQSFLNSPPSLLLKVRRGTAYTSRCKELLLLRPALSRRFAQKVTQPILFVDHHLAHAASAFLLCPWDEANAIVADGIGESATVSFYSCQKNEIKKTKEVRFPNSLGHVYASVTKFLGFRPCYDEGKIMALAAFGEDRYARLFGDVVKINPSTGGIQVNTRLLDYHAARNGLFYDIWKKRTGLAPRREDEPLKQRHKDLARSLQECTERTLIDMLRLNIEDFNKPLCAAGGLFLNAVMNGRILREVNPNYFIQPAAGDNGVSIGSALVASSRHTRNYKKSPTSSVFFGRGFSPKQIEKHLRNSGNRYHESKNICKEVAAYIVQGKIIGWYQGRMEFGPRALGNRSILANPILSRTKHMLNTKVKHREYFRPFAGSVLLEEGPRYFENYQASPYMLKTFFFKRAFRNTFPSITHKDFSCRIQTVSKAHKTFYALIQEVKKITGFGIILNTSLNIKDQPIVYSPQEALSLLNSCALDMLVMDDYVVQKE